MNIKRHIKADLDIYKKNIILYLTLLLSVFAGLSLVFAIKLWGGPFTINAITSFYGIPATLALAIFILMIFLKDLEHGTILFFMKDKCNRQKYLIVKTIESMILGIVYGVVASSLKIVSASILGFDIEFFSYVIAPIIAYVMFAMFYMLLLFAISLYDRSSTSLIIYNLLLVLVIPELLNFIYTLNQTPNLIKTLIKINPILFLVKSAKIIQFKNYEIVSLLICILLLFVFNFKFVEKQDY